MGVVILAARRTPVGSFGGALRELAATELGAVAGRAALEAAGVRGEEVDEVIFGSGGMPIAEANIARQIGLAIGLPDAVPAYSVQQNCASGLRAVVAAAQAIRLGEA